MSAVTTAGTAPLRTAPLISWTLTWATARRVLAQLRHDPRTVAMMLAVPAVLMILLRYVLNNPLELNRFAPVYIGVFPFVIMFIVAAITTQRERARGTLARWAAAPPGDEIEARETANLALIGWAMAEAAWRRQESRGAHYRLDFPTPREAWRRRQFFVLPSCAPPATVGRGAWSGRQVGS